MSEVVTVSDLVESVSTYLCDQVEGYEYQLVDRDTLLEYYNCALSVVYMARSDSFTELQTIPLDSGDCQVLPSNVKTLVSVKSVYVDGVESKPSALAESDANRVSRLDGLLIRCCDDAAADEYRAKSYTLSAAGGDFQIVPPIPEGADAHMTATVIPALEFPCSEDAGSSAVNTEFKAAIYEYMLYLARGMSSESAFEMDAGKTHFDRALDLLGISYRTYARIDARIRNDESLMWRQSLRGVNP